IRAEGRTITVTVAGQQTAQWRNYAGPGEGLIALQVWGETEVMFKDIEICELSSEAVGTRPPSVGSPGPRLSVEGEEPSSPLSPKPQAPKLGKINIRDAQSPAVTAVKKYLAAAASLKQEVAKPFLATDCKDDLIVEFQANVQSGWDYSEEHTKVEEESVSADGQHAVVKLQMVFKGGNTFMAIQRTFFLVLEKGEWKISRMLPKPYQTGPGVRPLF
ncbi:MAG: DUF1080 domain-containing protein, partial [Thermoguttaceae bacterium]|nr:DUF1080 domain-containing protein [Thermoguttaceae bacterium]MDW8038353.1 hypothetical protein [Thermoguttaceae bacterium]